MSFDIDFTRTIGERTLQVSIGTEKLIVGLVGPSGAGKTTALNCLAGLLAPDHGRIGVGGKVLFDSDKQLSLAPEQRRCGYVFQDSRLFPHLTVAQNLAYGRPAHARSTTGEIAALLDIEPLLGRYPASLSGGEERRVAIGRAVLSDPDFLLLDEPIASLDPQRGEQVLSYLERIRDELRLPTVYVSHDTGEIARLAEEVIALP